MISSNLFRNCNCSPRLQRICCDSASLCAFPFPL